MDIINEALVKQPHEVALYPQTPEDRIAYLGSLFGDENITLFAYEVTMGAVGLDRLTTEFASDFDGYYYHTYMPDAFRTPQENGNKAARNAYRRYYDVANRIGTEVSRTLFPNSDFFDPAREIMLPPDSPGTRAINYLSDQMTDRTSFEYFRHLKWIELAGKFISSREQMAGRTCFDNMWQNLINNLCRVKMGETTPVPMWSIHDNNTNAVYEIKPELPENVGEYTHIKFHPIDMYTLHPTQGSGLRFNLSPRLKEAQRTVLKYEEAVVTGYTNPEEKFVTDTLGTAVYVDGDDIDRNDFVDIFLHWFITQYPNSDIEERNTTSGTKGKGKDLNWRRFKVKISAQDDPSIQNGGASAEFIVSTMADYFTNEYELDSPMSPAGTSDGRAHRLHVLRRLKVLRPYHFPTEVFFQEHVAKGNKTQVDEALDMLMFASVNRARTQLLEVNRWDPAKHAIFT